MAKLEFDPSTVAPEPSREVLPAGTYLAHIIESDVVPTKSGGLMLKAKYEMLDGIGKGRRVWSIINLKNANPEAERIGQSQLASLCNATGVIKLNDSSQLHMKPLRIRVSVTPAGPDRTGVHREARNDVKGYEAGKAASFVPPAAPGAAATAPKAAAPWGRQPA